jgi:hypothetical protein
MDALGHYTSWRKEATELNGLLPHPPFGGVSFELGRRARHDFCAFARCRRDGKLSALKARPFPGIYEARMSSAGQDIAWGPLIYYPARSLVNAGETVYDSTGSTEQVKR